MMTSFRDSKSASRHGVAVVAVSATLAVACLLVAKRVTGQQKTDSVQDPSEFADNGRRTLWALDAGYKLPIEISSVRNFHNKHWMRDLRVEIKNISNRPIYCVYLMLVLPDDTYVRGPGTPPLSDFLVYGSHRLLDVRERPTADDKPLEPGASAVLAFDERSWRGYEGHLIRDKVPATASYRVRMVVLGINFGDGTGFTNGGIPFPRDPAAPRLDQRKYVKVPVESKLREPLPFQIPGVPGGLIGRTDAKPRLIKAAQSVCCNSNCDGNYLTIDSYITCHGCDFPGIQSQPCQVDACAITFSSLKICQDSGVDFDCDVTTSLPCPPPPADCSCFDEVGCEECGPDGCSCAEFNPHSPIIIDIARNGYSLTDLSHGVRFDLDNKGRAGRTAWTAAGSDEAFLALDRNGNGTIDDGKELFGNYTPLADGSDADNGWDALAVFDRPDHGGNGDGVIDKRDSVYSKLLLWQDTNHDGVSQPSELHHLADLGIDAISLDYQPDNRQDRYGNYFRFRSMIYGHVPGKKATYQSPAYDVFFGGLPYEQ